MKSLSEYCDTTPAYELYHFLAEAIIQKDISNFSALLEFASALPVDAKTSAVFVRLFPLVRKLAWGFFRDIDPKIYPKVWREIVIPNPRFPQCGDLKRNLTISEIYVGIIDLHGYTRFCEKNKNNLSMLQALDDTIQVEMNRLARERDVVLQRRQGDEMVLVGASAVDLIATTLDIIDFFSGKGAGAKQKLPEMHVSAGIAGGRKFTPFIITRDGDLSGGVVNTAARLQSRANELSGDRSRIVVSRTVETSYQAEEKGRPSAGGRELHFFDSGVISFKGIDVAVSEVLHDEADRYLVAVEKDVLDLYKSMEARAWKDAVFEKLVVVLVRILKTMGDFKIEAISNGLPATLSNDNLVLIAQDALTRFKAKKDYCAAAKGLGTLIGHLRIIPRFDRLILEYAEFIAERYQRLAEEYDQRLTAKIKEKAAFLPVAHKKLWEESRKAAMTQERIRLEIQQGLTALEMSQLWTACLETVKDAAGPSIYSGKR